MRVLLANKFFRPGAGAETAFFATRDLLAGAGHEVIDFAMASPENLPSPYEQFFAPERSYGDGGKPIRRVVDAAASMYSLAARKAIRRDGIRGEDRPQRRHDRPRRQRGQGGAVGIDVVPVERVDTEDDERAPAHDALRARIPRTSRAKSTNTASASGVASTVTAS